MLTTAFSHSLLVRNTFIKTIFACTAFLLIFQNNSLAGESSQSVRKTLFLLERQLMQNATREQKRGIPEIGTPKPLDAQALKAEIQAGMNARPCATSGNTPQAVQCSSKSKSTTTDSAPKDFGSVSAGLEGGRLTSFNYSSTGLDLTEYTGGSLVLFLQSNEIDISDLKQDENISDKFKSSASDEFYGLDEYKDMQNLFPKQAPGKDYTMTGVGMTFDMGAMQLGVINYSKPPEKKKKIFFGNDSAGPYQIGATGIIPGSEQVRVDGSVLTTGSGYSINYSKGEITFNSLVGMSSRIIIEYELAQSSGGAPGRFTGFRLGTPKEKEDSKESGQGSSQGAAPSDYPESSASQAADTDADSHPVSKSRKFALDTWGVSYFTDQVIDYRMNGNEFSRSFSDHTLMGFDGAMILGHNTEIGFEYAQSEGDKTRTLGRFASATFTIADTQATDLNPDGPYYLDEILLPIIENSDEVRINGDLLTRDTDYTLDPVYGHLRLKKTALDLDAQDLISVNWRYLTEEDRVNSGGNVKSDSAYAFKMKNEFGTVSHSYEASSFGPDYLQVGSMPTNQLLDEKQTIAWKPSDALDIQLGRALKQSMRDASTNLRENNETHDMSLGYKTDALSFTFKTDTANRFDNLDQKQTDTTTTNTAWTLDYTFNDKYKAGYKSNSKENENNAGAPSRQQEVQNTIIFSAKPTKVLTFDTTLQKGDSQQTASGTTRTRNQQSESYKIAYKPSKKLNVTCDLDKNTFTSADNASEYADETAERQAAQAIETADAQSSTGNSTRKIAIRWQPNAALSLNVRTQSQTETHASGSRDTQRDNYDLRYKISDSADLQYRVNTMTSERSNQSQDTAMESLILRVNLGLLPGGLDLDIKRDTQSSGITSTNTATPVNTTMRNRTNSIKLSAEPFWEGCGLTYEWSGKTGFNLTNDTLTPDRETRQSLSMDAPFIGESKLAFSMDDSTRSGSRDTKQRDYRLTLTGRMTDLFDLQLSWTKSKYSDMTSPEASTTDGELNVTIKGQREW